jgi:hypothetical protein
MKKILLLIIVLLCSSCVTTPEEKLKDLSWKIDNNEGYIELLKKSFKVDANIFKKKYAILKTTDEDIFILDDITNKNPDDMYSKVEITKVKLYGIDMIYSVDVSRSLTNSDVLFHEISTDKNGNKIGIIISTGSPRHSVYEYNRMFLAEGYARVNKKECKKPICKEWLNYEERARLEGLGMWEYE